ncbi:hypothetical protein C8R44DRAFT_882570 [Mycena epipterygia]|nr:hypothetical protein C8R44DRAFT_882570 [Mycena epipterygia]
MLISDKVLAAALILFYADITRLRVRAASFDLGFSPSVNEENAVLHRVAVALSARGQNQDAAYQSSAAWLYHASQSLLPLDVHSETTWAHILQRLLRDIVRSLVLLRHHSRRLHDPWIPPMPHAKEDLRLRHRAEGIQG